MELIFVNGRDLGNFGHNLFPTIQAFLAKQEEQNETKKCYHQNTYVAACYHNSLIRVMSRKLCREFLDENIMNLMKVKPGKYIDVGKTK